MYLHKSLLNEVWFHIRMFSLSSAFGSPGVLVGAEEKSVSELAQEKNKTKKKRNLKKVNEAGGSREPFCTQTQRAAYLLHPLFYRHSVHLISVDPCVPSHGCLSGEGAKARGWGWGDGGSWGWQQARPLPAADRAWIGTRRSAKKPIKRGDGEKMGSYRGK